MPNLTKRDLTVRISNGTGIIQDNVLTIIDRTLDPAGLCLSKQARQTFQAKNL